MAMDGGTIRAERGRARGERDYVGVAELHKKSLCSEGGGGGSYTCTQIDTCLQRDAGAALSSCLQDMDIHGV